MPLIKSKKKADYIYGIWKITESVNTLLKDIDLSPQEKDYLGKIHNTLRKKQSIAAKVILNKLINDKVHVAHNEHGAPLSKNIKNISISHSHKLSMTLISEDIIGIDIQLRSSKINLIQSKFLNQHDFNKCFELEDFLHHTWCSKEAIYKTLNGLPCSLKKNIFITNLNNNESIGLYKKDEKQINFKIYHEIFADYFISIAKKIT
jgi:phosphopantetheinyl transferase